MIASESDVAFNRTSMELKQTVYGGHRDEQETFNRTSMELKRVRQR